MAGVAVACVAVDTQRPTKRMGAMEHDVCAASALDATMRTMEIGGRKVLLARHGGKCHAIGATCPHAGAPLDEGVLRDGVVTCPWHKAAFRLATGERLQPPAVDDVPHYPVRIQDGRVLMTLIDGTDTDASDAGAARALAGDPRCFAIVGAGAAGTAAAQTLREAGFSGRVVLIGGENRLPYDRTILSKYVLSGQEGGEKTPLHDADYYTDRRIERRTAEVVEVDPAARAIAFADGSRLLYDAALIATGGLSRPIDVAGHNLPGVHLLRSADDAAAIVAAADRAQRVVVIGAGFIGLETAGSLRERGLAVTVVAPQAVPLERPLGPEIGAVFRRVHESHGVAFRMGDAVAAIEGESRVETVRLESGAVLPADLVVAGLGIVPATAPLHGIALRHDQGVDVDGFLSAAPGLYACGDIAAFPLYGNRERVRVEHWRVAQQHGRVAALNMLGGSVPYDAVPYFWTIHYRQRLDYVGHAEGWDQLVVDGDLQEPAFLAFYVKAGRVAAVAGWGRDRQMAAAIGLLGERPDWGVEAHRAALG